MLEERLQEKMFPSPCGDYGSYLTNTWTQRSKTGSLVSVPLRGLWFLSALRCS